VALRLLHRFGNRQQPVKCRPDVVGAEKPIGETMNKVMLYVILVAGLAGMVTRANALSAEQAQIVRISNAEPQQVCCYSGTDTPITVPNESSYILEVRVVTTVYDVEYKTTADHLPSNLVERANVKVRLEGGKMYFETPGGELQTAILRAHRSKNEMMSAE
jgi:hypothetical protein